MRSIAAALVVVSGLAVVANVPYSAAQPSPTTISTTLTDQGRQRIDAWQDLMTDSSHLQGMAQLNQVNDFFNQLAYYSDQSVWGREDYWATPKEFLNLGQGDCEDYAIAKYLTLKNMGVPDDRMRIAYVRALRQNQAHMVLLVRDDKDKWQVLDNLQPDIQPSSERNDLAPVYSFNSSGLFLLSRDYKERRIGVPSRLGHWRSVVDKVRNNPLTEKAPAGGK